MGETGEILRNNIKHKQLRVFRWICNDRHNLHNHNPDNGEFLKDVPARDQYSAHAVHLNGALGL